MTTCRVEDCDGTAHAHELCGKHLYRFRRYGDPLVVRNIYRDHVRRFWTKVDKNGPVPQHRPDLGPCWLWLGPVNRWGYGKFTVGTATVSAHRFAYEAEVGSIPEGLQIDHIGCDRKRCVNPAHMVPTTARENGLRSDSPAALNSRKTHCHLGHPFDEVNTYLLPNGGRRCRACSRERMRERRANRDSR